MLQTIAPNLRTKAFLGVMLFSVSHTLAGGTITRLGTPGDGFYWYSEGLSANGELVAGWGTSSPSGFRWSKASGFQTLPTFPGGRSVRPNDISGDGDVIVGFGGGPLEQAFRWTPSGGTTGLGFLPGGQFSSAGAVSLDGSVVVGQAGTPTTTVAFRWTESTGMQSLGMLPGGSGAGAWGVSADGSTVIGISNSPSGSRGFRWTAATGMESLGIINGWKESSASAVSRDGSVIIGSGREHNYMAYRWTSAAGIRTLGLLPGGTWSIAMDVSGDGETVIGYGNLAQGGSAFLWTASTGMVKLNDYLSMHGVDLSGWTLTQAQAISDDGMTMTGSGLYQGLLADWVATVPVPGPLGMLLLAYASRSRRR